MTKLTDIKLIIQSPVKAPAFQHYPVTTKVGYIYQKHNYLTNTVKGSVLQSAILGCVLQKNLATADLGSYLRLSYEFT